MADILPLLGVLAVAAYVAAYLFALYVELIRYPVGNESVASTVVSCIFQPPLSLILWLGERAADAREQDVARFHVTTWSGVSTGLMTKEEAKSAARELGGTVRRAEAAQSRPQRTSAAA